MVTMPVLPNTDSRLRRPIAALAALALMLGGCGEAVGAGSEQVLLSPTAMQSRIVDLANCPSPLDRLGIGRIKPKVMIGDGEVDFVIPAARDAEDSFVRFNIEPLGETGTSIKLRWQVHLSDSASELDLGDGRLLNPAKLTDEFDEALEKLISSHNNLVAAGTQAQANNYKKMVDDSCDSIGRIIDAIAVVTNPDLRRNVESQRNRDALGWLFKDNYRLDRSSRSPRNSEPEADYAGFYD